jgi:hypothetical protein
MILVGLRNTLLTALLSFTLTGCFDSASPTGPTHDVEWFKSHPDERQKVLETCSNNSGKLQDTENCINAVEAERLLSSGSLHNVDW